MTEPEATPVFTPALSPLAWEILVPMLWAGVHMKSTLVTGGVPMGPMAVLE